jgi:soluble lytic murein transglycosylase
LNCDALDTLELCKNAIAADSILACFMDSDSVNILCSTLSRLKALNVSDSLFLTKRLFQLSKTALQCKMYDDALMWLTKAKTRADFGTVITAKASLRHEALLEYYNSNYKLALSLLLQYKSQFGPIPEIIIAIARTYRNLGQDSLSLETYDLFSRLFPQNLLIESVLWNLALENDQRGNYDKAIFFYRKASLLKKNPEKSANALFRIGLCYYKAQKYSKACASFTLCLISFPDAPVAIACLYWKAQSLLANADEKKARNQFAEIIQTSPTDFYAYRAREALTLMGDTARLVAFDTACDRDLGRKWLDSISLLTGDVVTLTDSCLFVKTKKLALAGCSGIVGNYLEYLEKRYPSNLQLQYDLALIYELINNHAASFRVGRRIVWRLPAKDRSSVPQFVYNVSYPLAYFDIVKKAATADTVDPLFVLSIIKQESVFDYGIMSKAGAVGLMQLMPATAKEIAADLSEIYASDSLVKPSANIRYGTHYVKKLLDRFHGNMVQAIAGYNGGPPAIMRWFERNKSKNFDIFIEDIGYEETRNYVKKVLANYWTYTRLYKFDRTSMP